MAENIDGIVLFKCVACKMEWNAEHFEVDRYGCRRKCCIHCKEKRMKATRCPHGKNKYSCKACGNRCPHDKKKDKCKVCSPQNYCTHDRQKDYCKECGGNTYASMVSKQLSARNVKGLRSAFITNFVATAENVVEYRFAIIRLIDDNAGHATLRALFVAVFGPVLVGHWDGIKSLGFQPLNSSAVPSRTSINTSKPNLLMECAGNA